MKKCLVKKLLVSINNEMIPFINESMLRFEKVKEKEQRLFVNLSGNNNYIRATNGVKFINDNDSLESDKISYGNYTLSENAGYLFICLNSDQVDNISISGIKMDISNIVSFSVDYYAIEYPIINTDFKIDSISFQVEYGDDIHGSLLGVNNKITILAIKRASQLLVDLKLLNKCISLRSLNLYYDTNVTGTLESLLENLFKNGRTNNTINICIEGTKCTFNNKELTGDNTVTFTSSGCTVSKGDTILGTSNGTRWSY